MKKNLLRVLQIGDWDFGKNGIASIVYNLGMNIHNNGVIFDYVITNEILNLDYKRNIIDKDGKIFELRINSNGLKNKLLIFLRTLKCLKRNNYETVHIHESTSHMMLYYAIICRLAGVKNILLHSHSSGFDSGNRGIKTVIHKVSRKLLPLLTKKFLSCSKIASQWAFPNKYKEQVALIKNGINVEKFKFNIMARKKIRKKMGWENKLVIGNVGRLSYQKNHDFLIEIFSEISKMNVESILVIIGSGEFENQLKGKVRNMQLEEKVFFLSGIVDIENYFSAMDAFVLPSRFEGLPVVGVEAQANGVKCFFSNNITSEVGITDLCEFIPLEKGSEFWGKEVLRNLDINYREKYSDVVSGKGFLVSSASKELSLYYRKIK